MVDFVRAQLEQFGLPRHSIGFELTETAAISNLASASQLMHRLKEIGCPMALDDFGSGMASFAYLRGFPIDYLKIDGEFVKDMTTDAVDYEIVEAIHNVGRVMGIKTVAESVENADILAALLLVGRRFCAGLPHQPADADDGYSLCECERGVRRGHRPGCGIGAPLTYCASGTRRVLRKSS